jgi:hypothetical protein
MFSRLRTRTNPVFYPDQLRLVLSDEPDRLDRAFTDPASLDLLTWNVFASLDTHTDEDWLAYRLQGLGGSAVTAPVRLSVWSGRHSGPELRSSHAYVDAIRSRTHGYGGNSAAELAEFADPIEVPVRVETPDVLLFIDTVWQQPPRGNGGRDRLVELIDAGLDHSRRVDKKLAIGMVYAAGSATGTELSHRINQLRDPELLEAELPWREQLPPIILREMTWQQLLAVWEQERDYLDLGGQPVRAFLEHAQARGLR